VRRSSGIHLIAFSYHLGQAFGGHVGQDIFNVLVPEEELLIEEEVRRVTGALFGINQKGKIFFVLPGVPGENAYLRQFLESFLHKASPLLKDAS